MRYFFGYSTAHFIRKRLQLYILARHPVMCYSVQETLLSYVVYKGKADDQTNWRVLQHEKLARLREKLRHSKEQVAQG